ncbi:stalk domain-containing protein [Paenibacillus sedimenti]|uniref:GH26 domain-containing protein n=1 Tax=Paenibacillus sedimenti TaxID=2770274 RepID=A0A926KRR1_9BACL|nr:stalk domain-containing protein [Paenibacillus sedimenti]MBD0380855.1 hypothetical protein [Paenibacillus sedimenti]
MKKMLLTVLLLAVVMLTPVPQLVYADSWWNMEVKAKKYADEGKMSEAAPLWAKLVEHFTGEGTVGGWTNAALYAKLLGKYYETVHDYSNAVRYYEIENNGWLNAGKDWGAEDWYRAQELRLTLDLYVSTDQLETIKKAAVPKQGELAKFEPEYGVYLGMYSETDPGMGNHFDRSKSIYGKNHAIYLAYSPYDGDFPMRYADNAKKAGSGTALQIALEPSNGLDEVKDDPHLRKWAKDANAAGIPIFLRFASEMNGNWVIWHGNPDKYIEKFRIISEVMKEEAPNVAMVWSPNDVPRYSMAAYYPGDLYVDWVGVNLYTMPYGDGQPSLPGYGTSPVERLEEAYRLYADRKPIMISETGVAHTTNRDGKSHTDWAVANLDRLYEVMPKKYPRVKAITYFNQNMTTRESLNDYLLRDDPIMMGAYKSIIASPYYLDKVATGAKPDMPIGYVNAEKAFRFRKKVWIVPYIRIPEVFIGKVEYRMNGTVIQTQTRAPFNLDLHAGEVPEGAQLEVNVHNQNGKLVNAKTLVLSSDVNVKVDGKDLGSGQPPVIREGYTLAPLRAIFVELGAQVTWDPSTKTATGSKGSTIIRIGIGEKTAERNGTTVDLETPAELVNGNLMAPVRFIGEAFGGSVEWDGTERTVSILTSDNPHRTASAKVHADGFLAKIMNGLKCLLYFSKEMI